jgi:hypothetical protein
VGAMIVDVKQPLLLVTDEGSEEEVITRLSRVGFDNVLGYLKEVFLHGNQQEKKLILWTELPLKNLLKDTQKTQK